MTTLRDLGHRIATAIERDRLGEVHSTGGMLNDSSYDLAFTTTEGDEIEIVIRRRESEEQIAEWLKNPTGTPFGGDAGCRS